MPPAESAPLRTTSAAASVARLLTGWHTHGPAYAALAAGFRLLILDGRLPLGTRLPAERELAAALGVSRTTVTAAYAALREDGFLGSRRGSGSWTTLPADATSTATAATSWQQLNETALDLAHASLPAPPGLHRAVEAAVAELPRYLPGHGYDALGLPALRAAVADRYTSRGVPTSADEVLVTGGAQQGWNLLLRLLVGPGDRVLTDSPTYPTALDAAKAAGARLVPVPVTPPGWDLDALRIALHQTDPRLAYLVPDFHNPTGALMDEAARSTVADLAQDTGTVVAIDETLVDLALDGQAMPRPVAAHGPVVALGSMSKAFWGGLRIGWVRADRALMRRLAAVRAALDLGSPVFEQLVAIELLRDADSILGPRRADLRERRDTLEALLHTALPGWRWTTPGGGLVLWCTLDAPVSSALAVAAERFGVRLAAGPRFGVDGTLQRFLRVPYTLPAEDLHHAVGRLAAAYRTLVPDPLAPALTKTDDEAWAVS